MSNTARNRIIYNSQAVYLSPSSTGYHMQSGDLTDDKFGNEWTGVTGRFQEADEVTTNTQVGTVYRSLLEPLHRVQSANFNFSINKTDIIEFGKQARIDSIVMESPTVGLDLSYYVTDGGNERKLGFNVPSQVVRAADSTALVYNTGDSCTSGKSALSGHLEDAQGNNYFIAISKEGTDSAGNTITDSNADFDVISIGNGFISDYSVEAAVGSIPTASVSIEAFNIRVEDRVSGSNANADTDPTLPSIDITGGATGTHGPQKHYTVPTYQTGTVIGDDVGSSIHGQLSALRPGDMTFAISNSSSYQGLTDLDLDGSAHIQSFNISVPMSRTVLPRLGSTFGYARVIDVPITITCSISAIVSELNENNLYAALCENQTHDFTLTMKNSTCDESVESERQIVYTVKGARLESESFSNGIGDNQTVDITFTTQQGGANDTGNGLFIDGNYAPWTTLAAWPMGQYKDEDASYTL